jgi:hypothetical protein
MRSGFLLAMFGVGALVLSALILIAPRRGTIPPAQADVTVLTEVAQTPEAPARKETNLAGRAEMPPARPSAVAVPEIENSQTKEPAVRASDEQHEEWVAARIAELGELSAKSDGASLATLLAEVRNPDQEIREAALDAITQSGNRSAIPGLREVAAITEDARQKQAIEDVIEFMSLPTLTELLSQQSATNSQQAAPRRP